MSLLKLLCKDCVWEQFYKYKLSLAVPKQFTKELRDFIDRKDYISVCDRIYSGIPFTLPEKSVISKMGSQKKRMVYTYPEPENTVLKLLTHLLLRKYDGLFAKGLYSFRPGKTAKDAVRRLLKNKNIPKMYAYKADIHDYFNSVPVEKLLPLLKQSLADDEDLYEFLKSLLAQPKVIDRGIITEEQKGIMAGTPLSSFYANLFLSDLDKYFCENGVVYARYSDDIILFAHTAEERNRYADFIRDYLKKRNLEINSDKEYLYNPGDAFTFLGFSCSGNTVDIAPETVKKLKQKMRRKRDALCRWHKRNGCDGEKAAKAFVRVFNRKLFENPRDNQLSWSSWFFPVINTTESLHEIDLYAQDCIRFLSYGKHTKGRFNVRYSDLKKLGYRSLVNAYYAHLRQTENKGNTKEKNE